MASELHNKKLNFVKTNKHSWRTKKFVQWIKPPDITFNTNKQKLNRLVNNILLKKGRILDLGSGGRKLHNKIINFDLEKFNNVHIVGNALKLPFRDEVFELIIVTAVLEHVPYPEKVVAEIKRCLRKGGIVYAEVPFLQGFHADPHDYQRFTISGIRVLFEFFEERETGVCVGPMSGLTWYLRKFPTLFFSNIYMIKFIEFVTGWLFFLFKYFDFLLVRAKNAHFLASGIFFIGNKK